MAPLLLTEQHEQAAAILTAAGLVHGDTSKVALVVGVVPALDGRGAIIAHCPMVVRCLGIRRFGSIAERSMPIVGKTMYSHRKQLAMLTGGRRALMFMLADVHPNGVIQFTPDMRTVRVKDVLPSDPVRSVSGRFLAEQYFREQLAAL